MNLLGRVIKVLGLVLLVLAVGFALRAALSVESTSADLATPTTAEVPESEPAEPAGLVRPKDASRAVEAVAEEGRVALEPSAVPEEPSGSIHVRVVDPNGVPLGGVPILLAATEEMNPFPKVVEEALTSESDGIARLWTRRGTQSVPDGFAIVVSVEVPVVPRIEAVLTEVLPRAGEPPLMIEFVLDEQAARWLWPLRVQLVDANNDPLIGEQLAFRLYTDKRVSSKLGRATTTKPDGVATFSRDLQRKQIPFFRLMHVPPSFDVTFSDWLGSAVHVEVPSEPSNETFRLEVPPTGVVEVHILEADGTPYLPPTRVHIAGRVRGEPTPLATSGLSSEAGIARFELVALDLELDITATPEDIGERGALSRAVGPVQQGQVVVVEQRLGERRKLFTGRLLDGAGEPRANMPFGFSVDSMDSQLSPAPGPYRPNESFYSTDDEGRFRARRPEALTGHAATVQFRDQAPTHGPTAEWTPSFAVREVPPTDSGADVVDLGDIELSDVPVLVSGTVVDWDGQRVPHARIHVRYPVGEGDDRQWYNFNLARATGSSLLSADAKGNFELRGLQPLDMLELIARRKGFGTSIATPVVPGTQNLELVLEREEDLTKTRGAVSGKVGFDEGIPLTDVNVVLSGEGTERSTWAFGGVFSFDAVKPGIYTLGMVASNDSSAEYSVCTVDGIAVRAGEETRLADIDLRGAVRLLSLRYETENLKPYGNKSVQLRVVDTRELISSRTDENGRASFIVRSEHLVFELFEGEFERDEIGWSEAEQTVILRAR